MELVRRAVPSLTDKLLRRVVELAGMSEQELLDSLTEEASA